MEDRIDKILVELGLLKTRSQAKMLIQQECIYHNDKVVTKAGLKVLLGDKFEITKTNLYVSRGAYKLEKALKQFEVNFDGKVIGDIGASTGGFTQVALEAGASKVYAIDVGHEQLAEILKNDERVINMEGKNIKFPLELEEELDHCVVDLSFISIKLVYKNIHALLKAGGSAIVLIKPQFEAGKERLGKQGLVAAGDLETIVAEVREWFSENNFTINQMIDSPIVGNKSGNKEFLALITKD
jgi:23S rRNA (cytidine1920-2'-O)/16S rRNA (cytidine1409-2'-O)-methyltransferase